eukprot:gene18847-24632_t
MNDCDCINDVEGLFDANNPGGLYSVDLEEPYGRMVVDECLFLAGKFALRVKLGYLYNIYIGIPTDREKPKSLDELRGIPNPVPPKPSMPPFYPIAYRKLLELQVLLPSIYLSVDQVIRLLKCFPIEGYLRVQVFQSVFSHIVDLKNIYLIIEELFTLDEYEEACHRMGILNLFDPMRVDRFYALDLRRREYREWCKILIQLAIVEPGENWVDESYRYGRYDDPISGWILPNTWTQPDSDNYGEGGPRHFGWLTLTYRSEGFGCAPNIPLRQQLRKKTLIGFKRII